VDMWIKKTKAGYGIRSVICLLDRSQLRLYETLPMDLANGSGDLLSKKRIPRFDSACAKCSVPDIFAAPSRF
jgi:hypothetical protein